MPRDLDFGLFEFDGPEWEAPAGGGEVCGWRGGVVGDGGEDEGGGGDGGAGGDGVGGEGFCVEGCGGRGGEIVVGCC